MSVKFNLAGTLLLALRRRQPLALYQIGMPYPVAEFDHSGYYNSCTMKSCCFAGDQDQYVLSGSDDFRLYLWKIPGAIQDHQCPWRECTPHLSHTLVRRAHMILKDHRSIVNQVRYNPHSMTIASSGVEKIIKLWSAVSLPGGGGALKDTQSENHDGYRRMYTYEEYIDLVMESGQFMSHDYSHQSVKEDPRMMAFFDSLVQRDIEGWSSDSSNATGTSECFLDTVPLSPDCPLSPESATSLCMSSQSSTSGDEYASPPACSSPSPSSHTPSPSFGTNAGSNRIAQLIVQRRRAQMLRDRCLRHLDRSSKLHRKETRSPEHEQSCDLTSPQPSSSRTCVLRLRGCSKQQEETSDSDDQASETQVTENGGSDHNHNFRHLPHKLSFHSIKKLDSNHQRFRRLREKRRVLMMHDSSDEDSGDTNQDECGTLTDVATTDSINRNLPASKDDKSVQPVRSNGSTGTTEGAHATCSNEDHSGATPSNSNGNAHFKRLKQGFRNGRSYRNHNSRNNQ